ncbi:MAG TPA: hypothetical protein VM621_11280 [Luteibacter sp.]|uniref:hypothetical protein n=1 Tax=Luteibacter sp. TaxID=1886636 RepID=UPI002B7E217B|nr:hypothetical protein [Luteibacter sp.]HVI55613.1 hypothetical protein [Luteibacter sp.]
MKLVELIIGMTFLVSAQASATDDVNRTIVSIGAQTTTSAYVGFKEGTSAPCKFNLVFLGDMSQPMPKAMLAILISAQARGSLVSNVTYEMDASGFCNATKVEVLT